MWLYRRRFTWTNRNSNADSLSLLYSSLTMFSVSARHTVNNCGLLNLRSQNTEKKAILPLPIDVQNLKKIFQLHGGIAPFPGSAPGQSRGLYTVNHKKWYNNYKNRSRLAKVIVKNKIFYGSVCSYVTQFMCTSDNLWSTAVKVAQWIETVTLS